jgi:hypothetical protein
MEPDDKQLVPLESLVPLVRPEIDAKPSEEAVAELHELVVHVGQGTRGLGRARAKHASVTRGC